MLCEKALILKNNAIYEEVNIVSFHNISKDK